MKNKLNGILLILTGIYVIILVFNFDYLMKKKPDFGVAGIIGLLAGMIAIINGIRIYRRK